MADETFHLNRQTDSDNPMDVGQVLDQFMNKKNVHARYAAIQKEVFAEPGIKAFFEQNKDVLTRDIVNRDFAVLYEFYTQVKNAAAGKPVVHRGYKPMLEVTENRIVIVYQPDEETLAAQRLQMQANLVQSIGMPKLIERARLDDFSEDDGDRLAALTAVINFVSAYIADPKAYHRGLYIHGSYGITSQALLLKCVGQLIQRKIHKIRLMPFSVCQFWCLMILGQNRLLLGFVMIFWALCLNIVCRMSYQPSSHRTSQWTS